jgi:predicted phosphoribosyltransferase
MDLIVVRKVGHPRSPEYAIAAVAEDGHMATNPFEVQSVDEKWFAENVRLQQEEARRRHELFMKGRAPVSAADKIAIIVDDGLATGLTMMAAVEEVRHFRPRKVIVAVPVASPEAVRELERVADSVVVLDIASHLGAIGAFYMDFEQVSDSQVVELMNSDTATAVTNAKTSLDS